jgi:hypothetical protein
MKSSDVQRMIDMVTESIVSMKDNPEKYSEEYDAFYNVETNQWIDSKCDDPTCHYCMSRPERPLDEETEWHGAGLPSGTDDELRQALEFVERKGWDIGKATKKINGGMRVR